MGFLRYASGALLVFTLASCATHPQTKNPSLPLVEEGRAIRGDRNAPILIVEFSDFQCPYCNKAFDTVAALEKKYGSKIVLVYRHFPLPMHPLAMPAAKRFEAIALQNAEKAYRFHDEVFSHPEKLDSQGERFLDLAAKKAGADLARMKKDMESDQVLERIQSDADQAEKLGFRGTPAFIVAGETINGAQPIRVFVEVIDRHLTDKR